MFPAPKGKHPLRTITYPINNRINYAGIRLPSPIKDEDKLEAQNENLAMNGFGWENDRAIEYRLSQKPVGLERINILLTGTEEVWHYSFAKRLSALLYDQTKHSGRKHYCLNRLSRFTTEENLEMHEEVCRGINRKPRRTEMPKEGENLLYFQNYNTVSLRRHT